MTATRRRDVGCGRPCPTRCMTASGTSGHGAELGRLRRPRRPRRRRREVAVGRAVAGQPRAPGARGGRRRHAQQRRPAGPGRRPPGSRASCPRCGGRRPVVVSIWGRTVEDFAGRRRPARRRPRRRRAVRRRGRGQRQLSQRRGPARTVRPLRRGDGRGDRPRRRAGCPAGPSSAPTCPTWWRSPPAALEGGAEALTLVNTLLGMAVDVEPGRPVLGAGGGGLSGPAVHPVAVRAVWECRARLPDAPIVGVGGVSCGRDAVELLVAGADAVQVGTATFRDPRAPWQVLRRAGAVVRGTRRHRGPAAGRGASA